MHVQRVCRERLLSRRITTMSTKGTKWAEYYLSTLTSVRNLFHRMPAAKAAQRPRFFKTRSSPNTLPEPALLFPNIIEKSSDPVTGALTMTNLYTNECPTLAPSKMFLSTLPLTATQRPPSPWQEHPSAPPPSTRRPSPRARPVSRPSASPWPSSWTTRRSEHQSRKRAAWS